MMWSADHTSLIQHFFQCDPTLLTELEAHRSGDSHRLLRRLDVVHKKTVSLTHQEQWPVKEVESLLRVLIRCYVATAESIKVSRAVEKLWQPFLCQNAGYIKLCLEKEVMSVWRSRQHSSQSIAKVSVLLEQNKEVQEVFQKDLDGVVESLAALIVPLTRLSPDSLTLGQADTLYATVKICLQLFQVCAYELGTLVWGIVDSDRFQHVQAMVDSLLHILSTEGYQTDCVLLCGTAVTLVLNSCRETGLAVCHLSHLFQALLSQDAKVTLLALKSADQVEVTELEFIFSKLSTLTSAQIGPVALIRGLVSCGSQELLLTACGQDDHHRTLVLEELYEYICTLCKGDITLHYQAFQVLLLWYTRLTKLPSSVESSLFKSNFTSTLKSTFELVTLNWDSPVEDIPETVVDVFSCMMTVWRSRKDEIADFPDRILEALLSTEWFVKGKYRVMAALLEYTNTEQVLKEHPLLQQELLQCLATNHLASAATNVYKAFLQQVKTETVWKDLWLQLISEGLTSSNSLLQYNTSQHWIPATLKQLPNTATVLQGHFVSMLSACHARALHAWVIVTKTNRSLTGETNLEDENVREALYNSDEDIRSDAFSLVCTTLKKAECVSAIEVRLLKECLPDNMKIDSAPFRQHMGSDLRKLLVRMRDSCITLLKSPDRHKEQLDRGIDFVDWLHSLCIECLLPGACYQRRKTSLDLLHVIYDTLIYCPDSKKRKGYVPEVAVKLIQFAKSSDRWQFFGVASVHCLILCLLDGADEIRMSAYCLLSRYYTLPMDNSIGSLDGLSNHLLEEALRLCCSPKGHEAQSGAMLCRLVFEKYVVDSGLKFCLEHRTGTNSYVANAELGNTERGASHFLGCLVEELTRCFMESEKDLVKASKQYPLHGLIAAITECLKDTRDLMPGLTDICTSLVSVCQQIIDKMLSIMAGVAGQEACPSFAEIGMALENLLTENQSGYEEGTALSPEYQYMLSWCWNNIKESCASLGEITRVTIESEVSLSVPVLQSANSTFLTVLTKCRHKGVIEGCRGAYVQFCSALLSSRDEMAATIPGKTLTEVLTNLKSQGLSSSVTRRSAGLPVIIQAVLVSEKKLKKTVLLTQAVRGLFEICELPLDTDRGLTDLPQVHGLNIINSLFSDASLAATLIGQISHAVILVIQQFGSPSWAIRNAATRFFSTLVTKIFGQKKTSDEMLLNSVTVKEFSAYYPDLPPFILNILREASDRGIQEISSLHPGLFPALTLLSHLKPVHCQDQVLGEKLREIRHLLKPFTSSPVYYLRNLVASALVALVPIQEVTSSVTSCLEDHIMPAKESPTMCMNSLHGNLMYIDQLLRHVERTDDLEVLWNTMCRQTWLLSCSNGLVSGVYLKILTKLLSRCGMIIADEILEYIVCERCTGGAQVVGHSVCYESAVDFLFLSYHRNQMCIQGLSEKLMSAPDMEIRKACVGKLDKHEYNSYDAMTVMEMLCRCVLRETEVSLTCRILSLIHRLYQMCRTLGSMHISWLSQWFKTKFTKELASRDAVLATVLPVQAILIKESNSALPECIDLAAFCWTVYRFSQEVNETLRLAAVYALQTADVHVLELVKTGGSDPALLTWIFGACLTLVQDEDMDVRHETCRFVAALEWPGKPLQFSSFHSTVCFELLLKYIDDVWWSSPLCLELLLLYMSSGSIQLSQDTPLRGQTVFTENFRDVWTSRTSGRHQQLFEQEDNSFLAEKLYNAFVIHSCLQGIVQKCVMEKKDTVLSRLRDEKLQQNIETDLDFIQSLLHTVPSGRVINFCCENAVLSSLCSCLLLYDVVAMVTNCKQLKLKISTVVQNVALPSTLQAKFHRQLWVCHCALCLKFMT